MRAKNLHPYIATRYFFTNNKFVCSWYVKKLITRFKQLFSNEHVQEYFSSFIDFIRFLIWIKPIFIVKTWFKTIILHLRNVATAAGLKCGGLEYCKKYFIPILYGTLTITNEGIPLVSIDVSNSQKLRNSILFFRSLNLNLA